MSICILAIDTSTEACSSALAINGKIYQRFLVAPRQQTRYILPIINDLLCKSGIALTDLDAIAFSRGPGSFSGVRIGISVTQGLALGANIPVIGVSTLATLAQGAWRKTGSHTVISAIDARINEVYLAKYFLQKDGFWIGELSETILKVGQITEFSKSIAGKWVYAGTGWKNYASLITIDQPHASFGKILFPMAQDMLPLATHLWMEGKAISVEQAEPTYIRHKTKCRFFP